jgi:hypothetical protein
MRPIASAALLTLALVAPSTPAAADTIDLRLFHGELQISFGLEPFTLQSPFSIQVGDLDLDGTITLVSGPLLDLDSSDPASTLYTYGPGTFTLEAFWDENGTPLSGGLTTPVDGFSFSVCEGCDSLFGGGLADLLITPGNGLFDEALARALHVLRPASVDFIDIGLEDIDGDPASLRRIGFDHKGYVDVTIDTVVPEPPLLLLGVVSATALALRRRISRSA